MRWKKNKNTSEFQRTFQRLKRHLVRATSSIFEKKEINNKFLFPCETHIKL